ncbi:MAG TPA: transporter [Terriglobia bacterium]|nr:transporter [Terriglobia bacterium]
MRFRKIVLIAVFSIGTIPFGNVLDAQDLGHELPGTIGLDAGRVPEPGLYVVNRIVSYRSDELHDRIGHVLPIDAFRLRAFANTTGISYAFKLSPDGPVISMTAAAPLARLRISAERLEAGVDRFGLADIFIEPARLGWRKPRYSVVASYGFFLPTGSSILAGGTGLSSGRITHEFSAGGTIFADTDHSAFITAVASYNLNQRNRHIDITRGDNVQVQGGLGVMRFNRALEAGLAFYWLRQVRADRGPDLPPALSGLRDRVYGLGPEVAVTMKSIRSQARVRYEWDLGAQARPSGNILVITYGLIAHR